ncbi:hypothetical protein BGX23_010942 [Mortierella sp. AD031]|nr:hypothetical protein BGX23_010942 [Mortierella sp. AD031]
MAATVLPSYQQACLAPDSRNSAVYLVGGPGAPGLLEANYVTLTNVNAPSSGQIGSQTNAQAWSSGASKACFAYPSTAQANSVITLIQFGRSTSYMSYISPNGLIDNAIYFASLEFQSPKLFSWIGSFNDYNMFHMFAVSPDTVTNHHWVGLRMSSAPSDGGYSEADTVNYPTDDPLLAVGTYTPTTTNTSQGHSVIFDKYGQGTVYAATGSSLATPNNTVRLVTLSSSRSVNMNGISFSSDAIPITMEGTGYILDKAKDGNTTVIYSISPGTSSSLQKVVSRGGAPAFYPSIAATTMNNQIITYSAPIGGAAYFNSFDTTKGTWSGANLISTPPTDGDPKVPIGAIIGGVVGGLVLIALVAFLVIRHRRAARKNRDIPTAIPCPAVVKSLSPPPPPPMNQILYSNGAVVPVQDQMFPVQPQPEYNYQPQVIDPNAYLKKTEEGLYVPYQPPKIFQPYQPQPVATYDTNNSFQGSPTVFAPPYASPTPLRDAAAVEHYQ